MLDWPGTGILVVYFRGFLPDILNLQGWMTLIGFRQILK